MYRDNTFINREHINFLFDDGGLGDLVARLPAIRYIKDHYPHCIPHLWLPDYGVDFAKNLLPDVIIKPFSKGDKEYNQAYSGKKTSSKTHTNMRTHLVDNAFHVIVDKDVSIEYKNYLQLNLNKIDVSSFNLPERYVVITTGHTVEVREIKAYVINDLSNYVIQKGYIPVFLGSKKASTGVTTVTGTSGITGHFNQEVDYSKGLDLIDKTSLLEAGKIIAGAKAIVGLDNGLLHVAGCTQTPIVGAYTTVESIYRLPYRNNKLGDNCFVVEPDESLKCKFCQSNWEFVYDHDFRKCWYVEQKKDKEIQCTKQITAMKFITHLDKIL